MTPPTAPPLMPARPPLPLYVAVGIVALVCCIPAMLAVESPSFMDDAYYYRVALDFLATGQWREHVAWSYLLSADTFDAPAFGYWLPLPSLLIALSVQIFGVVLPVYRAAQLPFLLASATLPIAALWYARQWRLPLLWQGGAVLLTLFPLATTDIGVTTATPALYALLVNLSLIATYNWVQGREKKWLAVALVANALMMLTRNEAVVVIGVLTLYVAWAVGIKNAVGYVSSALLAVGLLMVYRLMAFGTASPYSALWLATLPYYNVLFHYDYTPLSFQAWLAQVAWRGAIAERVTTWYQGYRSLVRLYEVAYLLLWAPLLSAVAWRWLPERRLLLLGTAVWGAWFLSLGAVFPHLATHGSYAQGGLSLVPFAVAAGMTALYTLTRFVPVGRAAAGIALLSLLVGVTLLRGVPAIQTIITPRPPYVADYALLTTMIPPDAVVLTHNIWAFYALTNKSTAPLPFDFDHVDAAADQWGATYMVIEIGLMEMFVRDYPALVPEYDCMVGWRYLTATGNLYLWERDPANTTCAS